MLRNCGVLCRRRFSSGSHSKSFPSIAIEPLSKSDFRALVRSHYSGGKFRNLLRSVVNSPSLLLTACENLRRNGSDSRNSPLDAEYVSSNFFSIQELSFQLEENRFDVESCCGPLFTEKGKGEEALVLPNLKLTVVIEAIRIVLEAIYDDRFVTFSYGGRASMGRHTAVRYLKNAVRNPTWWFCVKFENKHHFGPRHVDKLCLLLGEKIDDGELIDLIKKLFEFKIIDIDLGVTYFGRGLPQECALSSILMNIYFDSFDQEVQKLRLKRDQQNPKITQDELLVCESDQGRVFYKPLKIFAVRYFNEILIITTGTKNWTLNLKDSAVKFLKQDLHLSVDLLKTVIHSAVSEKIEFMGMELQAVAPSVLRPTLTEKAIRARKKYLRQKEVRLQELKNARERNRKVLGMKLLSHVYKKSKQSSKGFEFSFRIEDEVKQIFSSWADEIVAEYLKSVDERWEWHRELASGDFLTLQRIRDQLPVELVDAFNNFQKQVDVYLNPVKARKELEEEARRREEEDENRYTDKTVGDLTERLVKVEAPLELLRKAVRLVGITNRMGRPRPLSFLTVLDDANIIKWYGGIARRWLDFYCCCHNFQKVKIVVSYHLRFSCILTLAEKHESTKRETIRHFSKDLNPEGTMQQNYYFPSEREIKAMGDRNLRDPKPVDGSLTLALIGLASLDVDRPRCVAHFCDGNDVSVYRIWLLQQYLQVKNPSPDDESSRWVRGVSWIHDGLHRKCVPLCSHHVSELYLGRLSFQDVDCTRLLSEEGPNYL
ncbi:hypothetical protein M569_10408 [Genlisea aurea]|uniref:Reverse transcriptase domain-containing protein n=1 Tax=Genlisea aurea TaxID=192259 RepID=S8DN09_9LAMI|nr:hypothetical protein M569_10408 [Genlisea aurea]